MKYRCVLTPDLLQLVAEFKVHNAHRTAGQWNPEEMVFPPGDPDRLFIEFITANADRLLAFIESHFVTEY